MLLLIPRIVGSARKPTVTLLRNTYSFSGLIPQYSRFTKHSRTMSTNPASPDELSSIFTEEVSKDILNFWFEDCGPHPTKEQMMGWFMSSKEFDERCRSKFAPLLSKITSYPQSSIISLATSPERALSLILLLDQFPRNLFRGDASAKVYTETDPIALSVSLHSISPSLRYDLGHKNAWKTIPSRRMWFYLPLTHSEEPALHERNEEVMKEVVEDCKQAEANGEGSEGLEFAKLGTTSTIEHKDVIDKFGRYPYRNKVLGREDTPEEKIWLENPVRWAR